LHLFSLVPPPGPFISSSSYRNEISPPLNPDKVRLVAWPGDHDSLPSCPPLSFPGKLKVESFVDGTGSSRTRPPDLGPLPPAVFFFCLIDSNGPCACSQRHRDSDVFHPGPSPSPPISSRNICCSRDIRFFSEPRATPLSFCLSFPLLESIQRHVVSRSSRVRGPCELLSQSPSHSF